MALPRLWALDDVTVTDPLPPPVSPLLPISLPLNAMLLLPHHAVVIYSFYL